MTLCYSFYNPQEKCLYCLKNILISYREKLVCQELAVLEFIPMDARKLRIGIYLCISFISESNLGPDLLLNFFLSHLLLI